MSNLIKKIEDKNFYYLLSNPDNIINKDIKIERNFLKEYIIKKFDLYNEFILKILYEDVSNYIDNIDIDLIIIKNILNEIIDNII